MFILIKDKLISHRAHCTPRCAPFLGWIRDNKGISKLPRTQLILPDTSGQISVDSGATALHGSRPLHLSSPDRLGQFHSGMF